MRRIAAVVLIGVMLAGCDRYVTRPGGGGEGTLHFVLRDRYQIGETVEVRLANDTEGSFVYQETYQACELTYTDQAGREFNIPPGTHCDIYSERSIRPGQTVTLFTWKLEECVVDEWGCVESEPLPPGTYRISGMFESRGETTPPVEVSAAFEIAE